MERRTGIDGLTVTDAIRIARREVSLDRFGGGWQVSTYDVERRAWWQHNPVEWSVARRAYRQAKICRALELLGVERADADTIAYDAGPGDFASIVRYEVSKLAR